MVVNLALLAAALAVPLLRQQQALETLRERREAVRTQAEAAAELRDALEARRARLSYVARLRGSTPAMVVVLEELSVRLPDTTGALRGFPGWSTLELGGRGP